MEKANFEDLKIYQESLDYATLIYRVSQGIPKEEMYGVISQMRRAAMSVPLNLAEGQSRLSKADHVRFLLIAKGSLYEMLAIAEICHRQNYMDLEIKQKIRMMTFSIIKQTQGLINYLKH